MNGTIEWLLEGAPYIRYRTRRDLLDLPEDHPQVLADREVMLAEPLVQSLLAELMAWPGPAIASHKSAGQFFHKLTFLADLGLARGDTGLEPVIERIVSLCSPSSGMICSTCSTRSRSSHGLPATRDCMKYSPCWQARPMAGGRFTAELVWQAWGEWEFGQKKTPSRWLTLLATRILVRGENALR